MSHFFHRTRYEAYLQGPNPDRGRIVEDPKWQEVFDRLAKLKYCPAMWAKGRKELMTFSQWLDWSNLYALTERVEETVFEDGREKQRGRVMPLRHLSLLLYYWAYVRSVRLYGIIKGTWSGYIEAVDKALEKAKNLRKGFPLEIKCKKCFVFACLSFLIECLHSLHRHQERRQWHSLVAFAVRQDVSRQA